MACSRLPSGNWQTVPPERREVKVLRSLLKHGKKTGVFVERT